MIGRCVLRGARAFSTLGLSGSRVNGHYEFGIPGVAQKITVPETGSFVDLGAAITNHSEHPIHFSTLYGNKIASGTTLRSMESEPLIIDLAARRYKLILSDLRTPRAEDHYFDYGVSIGIPASEATLLAEFIEKLEEKVKVIKMQDKDPSISRSELEEAVEKAMLYFAEYQKSSDKDPQYNSHAFVSKMLLEKQDRLADLQSKKRILDAKAERRANSVVYCGLSVLVAEFSFITMGTFYFFCWDIMEPIAYLMGTSNTLAAFALYILKNQELSPQSLREALQARFSRRLYRRKNFQIEEYEDLQNEIRALRKLLEQL